MLSDASDFDVSTLSDDTPRDTLAISVKDLSKSYHIYDRPRDRLLQMLSRGGKQRFREFWALRGISFDITKGETVGIIGRNGAGKSTLLQLICGTVSPTAGTVSVYGKVAALLELGAGFNPEFTGRENIYLAASLHGLTKRDTDERIESISSFADIGDFVDQPVKSYSSGMYVRLAFSVIAHVDADILIIDEALAVGDAYFQQKCMRWLRNFQAEGGTILFVSHDITAVTALCTNALYLSNAGNGEYSYGPAETIAKLYLSALYKQKTAEEAPLETSNHVNSFNPTNIVATYSGHQLPDSLIKIGSFRSDAEQFGEGGGKILNAWFESEGREVNLIKGGQLVTLFVTAKALRTVSLPAVGFMLKDRLGQYVMAESSDVFFPSKRPSLSEEGLLISEFRFTMPELIRGEYTMNFALADGLGDDHTQLHWLHDALRLTVVKGRLVQGIFGPPDLSVHLHIDASK